jgi:hypothetical protein
MTNLQEILFTRAAEALEALRLEQIRWPEEDHQLTRRTYCALKEVINEAGLGEAFQAWMDAR